MSQYDAPDWQRVVTTVTAAGVSTDAPDWQRVVVGPSGAPVGGGGGGGDGRATPAAFGWTGWTAALVDVTNSDHAANIRDVALAQFVAPSALTVSNVTWYCTTAGSGFVADHNYVGIYLATVSGMTVTALDLVASSAAGAADNAWTVAGFTAVPLSASYKMTSGDVYYLAQLWDSGSSSSRPYFGSAGITSGLEPSGMPWAWVQTGNATTSLPSSLTPSSLSLTGDLFFVATS